MTDDEVVALVREALFEVAPTRKAEFADVRAETKIDDLALDSIALMEMIGVVEDRVQTTFDEKDLARVQRVADLVRLVHAGSGAA
jgi:acyl carrier protein